MDTELIQAVAQYAEEVMGAEGFRYVSAVVANCKMLALELEAQEENTEIDTEALTIAAYLHDISTVEHGFQNHHSKSAEIAVEFLREREVPAERITKVEQAILAHTTVVSAEQRDSAPLENQVLQRKQ